MPENIRRQHRRMAGSALLLLGLLLPAFLLPGCGAKEREPAAEQIISIQEGEEIPLEGTEISLKIESTWTGEEVEPENPSGYYYYYNDVEDYHYHVVRGKLINPASQQVQADMFGASAWQGSKELDTKIVLESSDKSTFLGADEPTVGEEPGIYIITLVKDGDEEPDTAEFYYNDGLSEKDGDELWDRGIRIDP